MTVNRRNAIKCLSVGGLLATQWWPGTLHAASAPPGRFEFVAINDLHYINPACGEFLKGVLRQIQAAKPAFCLVLGDVTEHGKREDLAAVRDLLAGAKVPCHTVIGNHDYTTPESNQYYRRCFPNRLNYVFIHRGWQFIGLDTSDGQKYEKTTIQPATLAWVDRHLRWLSRSAPTVVFTHFPLGPGVRYRPLNADELLAKLRPLNLRGIFSGHFHGYTKKTVLNTVAYTNRCCALQRGNHDRAREKGYFLCTADPDAREVAVKFVEVEMPKP